MLSQTKLTHLFVGDFDTCREVLGDEVAFDGASPRPYLREALGENPEVYSLTRRLK